MFRWLRRKFIYLTLSLNARNFFPQSAITHKLERDWMWTKWLSDSSPWIGIGPIEIRWMSYNCGSQSLSLHTPMLMLDNIQCGYRQRYRQGNLYRTPTMDLDPGINRPNKQNQDTATASGVSPHPHSFNSWLTRYSVAQPRSASIPRRRRMVIRRS